MKKLLFALLFALFGATLLFACEECRKKELAAKQAKQGVLFTGWKLAPLQLGLGIDGWRGLADKDCDTIFSFVLFWMKQKSSVFSLSTISDLRNNYGIQLSLTITDAGNNYGLSLGPVTTGGRDGNHGLRIGIFEFGGFKFEKIQFIGVNCFDLLHLSLYNRGDQAVQIGLVNLTPDHDNDKGYFQLGVYNSGDTAFQIGLLNYNPRSYIPWLPLVNFSMKPKEAESHHRDTISVTIVESDGKKEAVYLPAR